MLFLLVIIDLGPDGNPNPDGHLEVSLVVFELKYDT
jgi:hypothetical protein